MPYIKQTDFLGIDAIGFGAGGYDAVIVPAVGANIVQIDYTDGDGLKLSLMRDTEGLTSEAFIARPQVYGIPVLFPPNRIEGGRFVFDGREYVFPITDKANNNHLHGFLHKRPWRVTKQETIADAVRLELMFENAPDTDFFESIPHEFEFVYGITLSAEGLKCDYAIRNKSNTKMPLGLGFHTAFRVPFTSGSTGSDASDYIIKATVDKRWELGDRLLPTGDFVKGDEATCEMQMNGVRAAGFLLDAYHFMNSTDGMRNGRSFNGAVLTDTKTGKSIVYEWGEKFRHSVIWNHDGVSGFICPEPQTWMINAPNVRLPDEVTGFYALEPGEVWRESTGITVVAS